MNNQKNGKSFEQGVEEHIKKHAPSLDVKRIDRTFRRGESMHDIELIDFPNYVIDCKYTVGYFSLNDLENHVIKTHKKYCAGNNKMAFVVYGQRKGKSRISYDDVGVAFISKYGLTCIKLSEFARYLENQL